MNKFIVCLILGQIQFAASASSLSAKSWVCDSKAATGFSNDRGYNQLSYTANSSYVIKDNISANELSIDLQKEHAVFKSTRESYRPASIKLIGGSTTELCTHSVNRTKGFEWDAIDCQTIMYGYFKMNLENGRFSAVHNNYSSSQSGQDSLVEVGECRRIN